MNPRVQLKVPEDSTIADLATHLQSKWEKSVDVSGGIQLFLAPLPNCEAFQDMPMDSSLCLKNLITSVPQCFSNGTVLLQYDMPAQSTQPSSSSVPSPPPSPPVTPSITTSDEIFFAPASDISFERLLKRQEIFFKSLLADQHKFLTEVIDKLNSRNFQVPAESSRILCELCDRPIDLPEKSAALLGRLPGSKITCSSFTGGGCGGGPPQGDLGEGFLCRLVEGLADSREGGAYSFSEVSAFLHEKDATWLLNGRRLSAVLHGLKPPTWNFDGDYVIIPPASRKKSRLH